MSEREIERVSKRDMKIETIKQKIQRSLCNPINQLDTDLIVVATTGRYMSFDKLTDKIKIMNSMVNKKLFGKRFNVMSKFERVAMTYFNQNSPKLHTHSHLLLEIPKDLDRDHVIDLMDTCWQHLADDKYNKFKIYMEKVDDDSRISNVIYSSRQLKDNYKDNEFGTF